MTKTRKKAKTPFLNKKTFFKQPAFLGIVVILIAIGGFLTFNSFASSGNSVIRPGDTILKDNSINFGVTVQNPSNSTLTAFEQAAGKRPSLIMDYRDFANNPDFPTTLSNLAKSRGQKLMLTWEPWNVAQGGTNQPAYSLQNIYNGTYDALISRWASEIKLDNSPLFLRFAHEMNGNWYPWSEQVNNNKTGDYVKAWQHIHSIFANSGVTNVTWVWCPNNVYSGSTALESLYPGDTNVDWTCVDGYNGGTTLNYGGWKTFDQVFSQSMGQIKTIAPTKQLMIGETASSEFGGSKATWIRDMFTKLPSYRTQFNLQAFFWFNWNKETDWRIESSAASQSAFAIGIASSIYK